VSHKKPFFRVLLPILKSSEQKIAESLREQNELFIADLFADLSICGKQYYSHIDLIPQYCYD
jgi:hypothetical protein